MNWILKEDIPIAWHCTDNFAKEEPVYWPDEWIDKDQYIEKQTNHKGEGPIDCEDRRERGKVLLRNGVPKINPEYVVWKMGNIKIKKFQNKQPQIFTHKKKLIRWAILGERNII